jgi:5-deoxy-glucuronate isomerase
VSLLVKARKEGRDIVRVTPETAGWKHVGFSAHRLRAGESLKVEEAARETCIVVISGTVDVEVAQSRWQGIGDRRSAFEDAAPYAVYLPPRVKATITGKTAAEIGVCTAPAQGRYLPRLIEPGQMKRSVRGKHANTRYVCDVLPETEEAESLLVVEVRTPSGHSSSYPPHKHDRDAIPAESFLEETYYHRLNPPQGFVFQRVYTDDRSIDESHAVEDGDTVMVPRGYHPVVVPYGYESYYLNVMAGPKRAWHFRNDPVHEWIVAKDR